MRRRDLLLGAFAALIAPVRPASAAPERPFDANAFRAVQAAGQGIVVQVHAPW